MKPFTHALTSGGSRWTATSAAVSGFFCFCYDHSDTMRYVSGSVLNNPVTRASQSGEGGPRIEPGGKAVKPRSLSSANAKT